MAIVRKSLEAVLEIQVLIKTPDKLQTLLKLSSIDIVAQRTVLFRELWIFGNFLGF